MDEFVALVSRVELSDKDRVAMFIEGLKGNNKKLVTVLIPKTLQHAIAFGKTLTNEDDPYGGDSKKERGALVNRTGSGHGNHWRPNTITQ